MDFSKALGILQERSHGKDPIGSHCVDCSSETADPGSAAAADTDLAPLGMMKLLRLLLSRQEQRVVVYRRFEDGFERFLQVTCAFASLQCPRERQATNVHVRRCPRLRVTRR
jgi:hypothetical protein